MRYYPFLARIAPRWRFSTLQYTTSHQQNPPQHTQTLAACAAPTWACIECRKRGTSTHRTRSLRTYTQIVFRFRCHSRRRSRMCGWINQRHMFAVLLQHIFSASSRTPPLPLRRLRFDRRRHYYHRRGRRVVGASASRPDERTAAVRARASAAVSAST